VGTPPENLGFRLVLEERPFFADAALRLKGSSPRNFQDVTRKGS
jgi:hypothetical protein